MNEEKSLNILVISNDDIAWLLPAWHKVLLTKSSSVNIKKLILVPEKLSNLTKLGTYKYYLTAFGIYDFFLLGIFYVIKLFKNLNIKSELSKHTSIRNLKSFDIKEISDEIKLIKPDIVFITCGYIIPKELLNIDKEILWINKHASLLPEAKGLMPYIWNIINNKPQGISFHEVNEHIDSGDIIYQEELLGFDSMVSFYKEIYYSFDKYFFKFINCLSKKRIQNISEDYFSLPNRKKMNLFRKNKGKIIKLRDLS